MTVMYVFRGPVSLEREQVLPLLHASSSTSLAQTVDSNTFHRSRESTHYASHEFFLVGDVAVAEMLVEQLFETIAEFRKTVICRSIPIEVRTMELFLFYFYKYLNYK